MKCPVPGCTVDAPPRGVTCPIHWLLVPKAIRQKTRETFDPAAAPEDQSPGYLVAAAEAARAATRADERLKAVPKITVVSIPRPWAWAVAAGVRPLENRSFAPPLQLIGQRVAIFASEIDREGAAAARQEFGLEYPPAAWEGGIVALAILDRAIGRGSLEDPLRDSPWFSGRSGWVFREIVAFPPWSPTRAAPLADLFTLPDATASRVWYRRLVSLARVNLCDPLPREVPPIAS